VSLPTVLDRFIQQAVMQVLQRQWDRTFSDNSYGFRPGRSARQAVAKAQQYIADGYGWVVDLDLEKFFDRVNHDKLMGRVATRVEDPRLLKLIRAFLNAGVMENGLVGPAWRVPRKGVHFHHCSATSCSTTSTENWSDEDIALFDTQTTATSTCVASGRVSG
jgi:retron-type reverse transcriptase